MKKIIVLLIALLSISFAVDYVGVNSGSVRGKFSKTSSPTFAQVTTTTWNYVVTGNVTCNTLVVTSSATIPVATITTASITNLGAALNTKGYAITGGSNFVVGIITSNISAPTTLNLQNTQYLATCPSLVTTAVTISTGNINIPVIIKGVTVYIKANTSQ